MARACGSDGALAGFRLVFDESDCDAPRGPRLRQNMAPRLPQLAHADLLRLRGHRTGGQCDTHGTTWNGLTGVSADVAAEAAHRHFLRCTRPTVRAQFGRCALFAIVYCIGIGVSARRMAMACARACRHQGQQQQGWWGRCGGRRRDGDADRSRPGKLGCGASGHTRPHGTELARADWNWRLGSSGWGGFPEAIDLPQGIFSQRERRARRKDRFAHRQSTSTGTRAHTWCSLS